MCDPMVHWKPICRLNTLKALWSTASGIQSTGGLEYSCRLTKKHIDTHTGPEGKQRGERSITRLPSFAHEPSHPTSPLYCFTLSSFSLLPNLLHHTATSYPHVFSPLPPQHSLWSMLSAVCISQSLEIYLRLTSLFPSTPPCRLLCLS